MHLVAHEVLKIATTSLNNLNIDYLLSKNSQDTA